MKSRTHIILLAQIATEEDDWLRIWIWTLTSCGATLTGIPPEGGAGLTLS